MNKEPLNVYGRRCVCTMLIDFARSENLELSMEEHGDWLNVRFSKPRGERVFKILWPKCENAWSTVDTVIKHTQAWLERCERNSESEQHLELGKAFAEGLEAGMASVKCPIMNAGMNANKSTISAEKIREVFERAKVDGVIANNKWEIKLRDIDEWSKMPPYLIQQQLYLSLGRRNGKTALKQAFMEYYDYMKQADIPISKQIEECAEYCRKDVEMTNFLYKNFNLPKDKPTLPEIKDVIFNEPATIVLWADGTKTVVQSRDGDIYDPEKGLAMAISKKIMGNKRDYYHTFKHWLKRYKKPEEVQEFEFTIRPDGAFKFDPIDRLDLCRGEFTFHFDNKKEDE